MGCTENIRKAESELGGAAFEPADTTHQLDKIIKRSHAIEEMVELIAFELWSHDMPNLVKLHGSWEEKSDKHRSRHYKQSAKELQRAAKKQAMILEESALARVSTEQKENDSPPKGNENGRSEPPQ